jgi:hypothetical protein
MQRIVIPALTVAALIAAVQAAQAAPLRCSAEEKACIAQCNAYTNRGLIPTCIANCRTRMAACRQTGCWTTGPTRYCGLERS